MTGSRATQFSALDEQLEEAVRSARTTRPSPTKVVVGDGEPVELPIESLKTLHKVVHALASGKDAMLTTTEAADFLGV